MSKNGSFPISFLVNLSTAQLPIMYKLNIDPTEVHQTLGKHILADGFDLTFDLELVSIDTPSKIIMP